MRRIVRHAAIGVCVSALTTVAVVGSFGHADAASESTVTSSPAGVPAPVASTTPTAPAVDPAMTAVEAAFGTSRSGISRPAVTSPMNVAKDARLTALATQAQQTSQTRVAILQQRQLEAAQKEAAAAQKEAADAEKKAQEEAAAQAARIAQAQQQQQADQQAADEAAARQQAAAQAAAQQQAADQQTGQQSGTNNGGTSNDTYSGTDPRSIARQMMQSQYGWGSDQFSCLDSIYLAESNWDPTAENRSSGAYGIPQSLPGSKMASAGSDWRTNPATQIKWGLAYIKARYGTPCGALNFRRGHNYY